MNDSVVPTIRRSSRSDVPRLIECDPYAQAHTNRRVFIRASVERGECLVGVAGTAVQGFVIITHNFFERGFVPLVAVAPAHRRNGAGVRLLAAAEGECKTPKLFTSTNASNIAAQAFLAKAGFKRCGLVEQLDEQYHELIYFKVVR